MLQPDVDLAQTHGERRDDLRAREIQASRGDARLLLLELRLQDPATGRQLVEGVAVALRRLLGADERSLGGLDLHQRSGAFFVELADVLVLLASELERALFDLQVGGGAGLPRLELGDLRSHGLDRRLRSALLDLVAAWIDAQQHSPGLDHAPDLEPLVHLDDLTGDLGERLPLALGFDHAVADRARHHVERGQFDHAHGPAELLRGPLARLGPRALQPRVDPRRHADEKDEAGDAPDRGWLPTSLAHGASRGSPRSEHVFGRVLPEPLPAGVKALLRRRCEHARVLGGADLDLVEGLAVAGEDHSRRRLRRPRDDARIHALVPK